MCRFTLQLLLILILSVGATYAEKQAQSQQRIDDLCFKGIVLSPKQSEGEAIKQLGNPSKKELHSIHNPYYDFDDKLISYEYPGLTVDYYRFAHPKYGWTKLVRVSVADDRWPLREYLTLNLPLVEVQKILGPPKRTSTEEGRLQWYYFPSIHEPHLQIICVFEENKLAEIVWSHMP